MMAWARFGGKEKPPLFADKWPIFGPQNLYINGKSGIKSI